MINQKSDILEWVKNYFKNKNLPERPALSFTDVAIEDNYSSIGSRSDIRNLRTHLAKNIYLNAPVVSANMDTVTNAKMAIALARLGGLGFIHQFFPLDERIAQVKKVKRADNALIKNPLTILTGATLREAQLRMMEYQVSSVLVIDEDNRLLGILTTRDYKFKDDDNLIVDNVMKKMPLVTGTPHTKKKDAELIFDKNKLEKLPLVDKDGKLCGLMTAKDILKEKEFPNAARDKDWKLMVGAAIRLNDDYLDETRSLLEAGADVILLDTARANSKIVCDAVIKIKEEFPDCPLVVGNIDTAEAAYMLIQAGADCLKIGIGPGSACKTRVATGVGSPQLYAVARCAAVAKEYNIPIIADGGIRSGGDLSKAIVAGANLVMMGSLLSGTDESPGDIFLDAGKRYKMYRGSASAEHQYDRMKTGSLDGMRPAEGIPRRVPYSGSVNGIIFELLGGLRSSMSYVGARDLNEFWEMGKFIWQTNSGHEEGKPKE